MTTADLVLDARAGLGEGPVWIDGALWWVDVEAGEVHRFDPDTREDAVVLTTDVVSAIAPAAGGGLLLARPWGLEVMDGGTTTEVWRGSHDASLVRLNDMACDSAGRAVVGSMDWEERRPLGSLHIVSPTSAVVVADGLTVSNGIGWSPDGRWMYHTDSPRRTIDRYRYDVDAGVALLDGSFPVERPGVCDGLAVDTEGCIWAANWGGWSVRRYTPDGRLDRTIDVPASQVTSCAFGGPDLTTLYVTTARRGRTPEKLTKEPAAGGVFAVDVGIAGMATGVFDDGVS